MYEGPIITCKDFIRLSAQIASREVRNLQKRFSYAYSDAVACIEGKTTITLDLEDLDYVLCVLDHYQKELQEVIKDGQNKEQ